MANSPDGAASLLGPGAPLGRDTWCRWYECRGCDRPREFLDRDDAVRWLQALAVEPTGMIEIRQAVADGGDDAALWRTDDPQAIALLAGLLTAGRVRVCGTQAETALQRRGDAGMSGSTGRGPSAAVAPSRLVRPASAAPLPQEAAPVELDVAAMVQVLVDAARDGVPFCEECERARQQAAQAA